MFSYGALTETHTHTHTYLFLNFFTFGFLTTRKSVISVYYDGHSVIICIIVGNQVKQTNNIQKQNSQLSMLEKNMELKLITKIYK